MTTIKMCGSRFATMKMKTKMMTSPSLRLARIFPAMGNPFPSTLCLSSNCRATSTSTSTPTPRHQRRNNTNHLPLLFSSTAITTITDRKFSSTTTETISLATILSSSSSQMKIQRQKQQYQHQYRSYHLTPSSSSIPSSMPLLFRQRRNWDAFNNNNNKYNVTLTTKRWHGGPHVDHDHADEVHISFVLADSSTKVVDAFVGESLLQVAQRNDIDLEGACEGVCACSTCHIIVPGYDNYDSLEEPSEDEEDMLDMAFGLTETSRLGCQVMVCHEMDGIKIEVPKATRNFYVDGHVPVPH